MPPKARYTKDEIGNAAYQLIRNEGTDALTARSLAAALGTSTAPIFTAFSSIDEVTEWARTKAKALYEQYLSEGFKHPLPFKGAGLAYIRFAKEEPKLFRFLFMEAEGAPVVSHYLPGNDENETAVRSKLEAYGHDKSTAMRIYNHLSVYVHGLATLYACGAMIFTEEDVEEMLSEAYHAFKSKAESEKKEISE